MPRNDGGARFSQGFRNTLGGDRTQSEMADMPSMPVVANSDVNQVDPRISQAALARLAGRGPRNPLQTGEIGSADDMDRAASDMANRDLNSFINQKPPQPGSYHPDPTTDEALHQQHQEAFNRGQQLKANQSLRNEFLQQQKAKYSDMMSRGEWPAQSQGGAPTFSPSSGN